MVGWLILARVKVGSIEYGCANLGATCAQPVYNGEAREERNHFMSSAMYTRPQAVSDQVIGKRRRKHAFINDRLQADEQRSFALFSAQVLYVTREYIWRASGFDGNVQLRHVQGIRVIYVRHW